VEPPSFFCNGFGTCNFLWRAIAPTITAAGPQRIPSILLGHGQSDRPLDADFESLRRLRPRCGMTVLRVSRAVIVGVDFGGDVAMSWLRTGRTGSKSSC